MNQDNDNLVINLPESQQDSSRRTQPGRQPRWAFVNIAIFILGLGSGYLIWGRTPAPSAQLSTNERSTSSNLNVSLPQSYTLPINYGELGPRLIDSGAIEYDQFLQIYENAGRPLTNPQKAVFQGETDRPIVIDQENAYFLLNFFWAFGLSNDNSILTEGPMMSQGVEKAGGFASTGGWTIGVKPPMELYASTTYIRLTPGQQARLERVAENVYRPCCNNPTHFPDCNHGMAMLGMLELLASQDASEDEMFEAAKYFNAFWYPQQTHELATFFKVTEGSEFAEIDAQQAVSPKYFSGSGYQGMHQWLLSNVEMDQEPGGGNGCGV